MSTTTAYSSQGSKMEVLISASWVEIVQSEGWDGPSNKQALEEITNLSSSLGAIEKIPISQEVEVIAAVLIYNPAHQAHAYLRASNKSPFPKVLESFRFTSSAPTPEVLLFSAYVTLFKAMHKSKTSARVQLELTPTGPLT